MVESIVYQAPRQAVYPALEMLTWVGQNPR